MVNSVCCSKCEKWAHVWQMCENKELSLGWQRVSFVQVAEK